MVCKAAHKLHLVLLWSLLDFFYQQCFSEDSSWQEMMKNIPLQVSKYYQYHNLEELHYDKKVKVLETDRALRRHINEPVNYPERPPLLPTYGGSQYYLSAADLKPIELFNLTELRLAYAASLQSMLPTLKIIARYLLFHYIGTGYSRLFLLQLNKKFDDHLIPDSEGLINTIRQALWQIIYYQPPVSEAQRVDNLLKQLDALQRYRNS